MLVPMMSFAPTCTNICAKLVLDKTEPYKAVSAAQHCCYQHCIAVMVLVAYTVTAS